MASLAGDAYMFGQQRVDGVGAKRQGNARSNADACRRRARPQEDHLQRCCTAIPKSIGEAIPARTLRVPTKPAMHSNLKPAGYSDRKPATLGVNRMGRFDDVVGG
jgi:hypothetical protein